MSNTEQMVWICRSPETANAKVSEYPIDKIMELRWDNISGGVKKITKAYYLYGYIPYEEGMYLVDCSGQHNYPDKDNMIKICIVKSKNRGRYRKQYIELVKQLMQSDGCKTDERKRCEREILEYVTRNHPKPKAEKSPTCKECIIRAIEDNGSQIQRGKLYNTITGKSFQASTFRKVLKDLKVAGEITLEGSSNSCYQIISKV